MTRELQWGRARELQKEGGGKRNQKYIENEKRPVVEQERSEQKHGYVETGEYLWDKFVLLLSAAKSAEQGDLDWGNWWLQVWEIMKCRNSRTGRCAEVRGWDVSHPQGGWKPVTAVRETLAEAWVEIMSVEPLGSCGAVRIKQSDETLERDRVSFSSFFDVV